MPRRVASGSASAFLAAQVLRDWTGRRHVLLTGRAAAGLWAALRALGWQQQPIGIPANTCYIMLWAIIASGNTPVLLDVDPATGNLGLDSLIGAPRLAAVIPTHLYGLPAPMQVISDWARATHTLVIEDAAQAAGLTADGRPAGSWGDFSLFSFGPGKIADVEGGGALLTDDERLAHDIKQVLASAPWWSEQLVGLTDQWNQLYWALHQFETENPALPGLYPRLYDIYRDLIVYRLPPSWWSDLPDALRELPAKVRHRAAIAALYDDRLNHAPLHTLPRPAGAAVWRYPLLAPPEQRDRLLRDLWQQGFHEVTRWYPSLRPMLAALCPDLHTPPTPTADRLGAAIINLPVATDDEAAERLAAAIWRFLDSE
ncbi:MAG: DegT/DnrJ/EryC1/StrS family aminotransferase [Chloroflexi bacterium]|nr:DegT/DnrJ/EryC1/StrS family aminotransferase [Chloroflexota bacterium]